MLRESYKRIRCQESSNNVIHLPAIQALLLQFFCDFCGNAKHLEEVWINGIAAENIGTHAARREVIIDPAWCYERAVQPFAVHFCSVECKDRFLAEVFQAPPGVLEVERVEVFPAARVVHARKKPVPGYTRKRKTVASFKTHKR